MDRGPDHTGQDHSGPLTPPEFSSLMAELGPFENTPHVAVGVSGGADSLALCLLVSQWLGKEGRVTALTVDHGLRPDSCAEAEQVGGWLEARGIDHHILSWEGVTGSALQARARDARYGLMEAWCRQAGVLHLLTAHHQGDQAETYLMRKARGSGPYGLAAMAAVSEKRHLRLLRPLLDVPKSRLLANLREANQPWIEDPSNRNEDFERVRVRNTLTGVSDICAEVRLKSQERSSLERKVANLLARGVKISPLGSAILNPEAFIGAGDVALQAFSGVLRAIGGANYAPHREKVERAFKVAIEGVGGTTLGGCVLSPSKRGVLLTRELVAIDHTVDVRGGDRLHWDGRFEMRFSGEGEARVAALGAEGWSLLKAADKAFVKTVEKSVPSAVRRALPGLFLGPELLSIPSLGYWRGGLRCEGMVFRPHNPVT